MPRHFNERNASRPGLTLMNYYPSFDYLAIRDGLSFIQGGPTHEGYQTGSGDYEHEVTAPKWVPRMVFTDSPDPKGSVHYKNPGRQFYADPEYAWPEDFSPFAIENGNLRIRAQRTSTLSALVQAEVPNDPNTSNPYEWVSGAIVSKYRFEQKGGFFEIEAKIPEGKGVRVRFSLISRANNEAPRIDIMDFRSDMPTGFVRQLVHTNPNSISDQIEYIFTDTGKNITDEFHKFSFVWKDGFLNYYFDGNLLGSEIVYEHSFLHDLRHYIAISLSIGDDEIVESPDETTPDTLDLIIKSVRSWQSYYSPNTDEGIRYIMDNVEIDDVVGVLYPNDAKGLQTGSDFVLRNNDDGFWEKPEADVNSILIKTEIGLPDLQFMQFMATMRNDQGGSWTTFRMLPVFDSGTKTVNLLSSPTDFTDVAWTKEGVSITGTMDLSETETNGNHGISQEFTKDAEEYMFMVYADIQKAGRNWVRCVVSLPDGTEATEILFNVAEGAVGDMRFSESFPLSDLGPICAYVDGIGNQVHRCQVLLSDNAQVTTIKVAWYTARHSSDFDSFDGDASKGVTIEKAAVVNPLTIL